MYPPAQRFSNYNWALQSIFFQIKQAGRKFSRYSRAHRSIGIENKKRGPSIHGWGVGIQFQLFPSTCALVWWIVGSQVCCPLLFARPKKLKPLQTFSNNSLVRKLLHAILLGVLFDWFWVPKTLEKGHPIKDPGASKLCWSFKVPVAISPVVLRCAARPWSTGQTWKRRKVAKKIGQKDKLRETYIATSWSERLATETKSQKFPNDKLEKNDLERDWLSYFSKTNAICTGKG